MKKYYSILCFIIIFILFANKNNIFAQCNNVALGKPSIASNYAVWAGAIPGAAVDGDCNNAWNAGTFAPQYWQVDLLATYTINNINIMFDMTPDGNVYHQILTSPDMINWTLVDTIVGYYYTYQLIERCYSASPLTNVRGIRVNTLTSPSWVSILDMGVYTSSTQTQPTITFNGPLSFCLGDSVTLTSSAAGSYLWSNGATTQSIKVGSSGIYSVSTNLPICVQGTLPCTSCGYGTASATVIVNPKPLVNFGNDTTLTQGSTLNLNAGNAGSTYLWSTNDTTQTININTSGTYWVKVTNSGGCFSSDTIHVDFTTTTTSMNDTTICRGETLTLMANAPVSNTWQYFQDFENTVGTEWSDTNRFTFNGSKNLGPYIDSFVTLNLNSLPTHDSVEVCFDLYIHDSWDGNLVNNGNVVGPDAFIFMVNTDTILYTTFSNLNGYPQSYPSSYLLANNPYKTASFLSNLPFVFASGYLSSMYKLSFKVLNSSNTLYLRFVDKTINVAINHLLDESWSIDNLKVKLLNVNTSLQYLWSTGATTATISVSPNQTTNYTVTVTNGSITFVDSSTVYVLNPQINNGQDTTICKGESVVLTAQASSQNICSKSQLPANLQQGLVAYYPFCGNANDESGNAHNGTVNGATITSDRFGNTNCAFSFDGVSSHISADSLPLLDQNFTYSCWIKLNGLPSGLIQSFGALGDINVLSHYWNFSYNLNSTSWDLYDITNGSWYTPWSGQTSTSTLDWTNVTIVYNNTIEYLYVNGLLLNQRNIISPINFTGNKTLRISEISTQHLNGKVDDVFAYNRPLSPLEVSQLFNLGNQSSCLWSTNDTTQSITVTPTQTTTYTLNVTNGNISCMDTITVNVLNPQINNGADTTICKGESVVLSAQASLQNICSKSQLPANLQQGLVAYYPFCGNANDESGNGNNGTVMGATLTTDRIGNVNSAYGFNGNSNYITVSNSNTLSSLTTLATICGWVFPVNGQIYLVCKSNNALPIDYRVYYGGSNFSVIINGNGYNLTSAVPNNQWSHIVVKYSNNIAELFVNGIYITQASSSGSFVIDKITPMEIGRDPHGAFEYHNGKLDDIFIYNRALFNTEIQQIYNLSNAASFASYHWSTNDTTQSITVTPTQTTTYTLNVSIGNISCMDTITVNVLNPKINNGNDTIICKGDSLCLSVTTTNSNHINDSIAGFTYLGVLNNHLYYMSDTATNWNNAKQICNSKGGHLATINSYEEELFLTNLNGNERLWLGLTDELLEGQYKWITGEPLCCTYWGPNEPNNQGNEDYILLENSDCWNDAIGNDIFKFILELQINQYLWSTSDTTQSISVSPIQTTSYSVLVTNGTTSCSDTIIVNVSNPQINLGNDTTICQGQNKTLAVGSGYTSYLWSTGATSQQITVQNNGSYWVKAISNQGCTVRDTINLTFLPVNSNVIRDSILCIGQNLILNPGLGFTNHQWSTGATTSSLAVSLPGIYWIQAKQANGCMIQDTAIVKYDSINLSITSFTNPACFGGNNGSINTTVNSLYPPFTYSWNTTPVQTTQNLSNLTAGNYTLTLTDSLGCSKTLSKTLSNPGPVNFSLGNDTSFCQGGSVILQPSQSFSSYLWSNNAATQTISVNAQGSYWLKVTNASGCNGYDTINVTMNPTPALQIAPTNPSICKGESIILTVSSNLPSTTYVWNNLATTTTINVNPLLTSSYYVVGKLNQCVDTAFVTLTVKPLPVITTSADKNPVCEGETVILTAVSDIPSTTFVWNTTTTGSTLTVNPQNSTFYFVTGTANNCQDTSGITINVIPKQIINLGEDTYLCAGDEINLTVNNLTGIYLWNDGSNSNTLTVKEPGVYWLKVDNNGCMASDSIEFKKCSEIWVPNVFTPNDDGINDVFKATTKEINKLQMMIYNRWGNLIFETQDINTGWNGKYAGGDAQSGVYYWAIKYTENRTFNKNVEKEIHGSVTLLR